MSFGSAGARQLGPLLMRRWEHFSSRLAPHFPTMGLQGCTRCIVGAGGRELGQVSATLDISPCSWHQLAPPVPHPDGLLSLLHGGGEGGGGGMGLDGMGREGAGGWGRHVKGRPGTSSLTGHPCHDMTWPLGELPAVRGRSNVVRPCSIGDLLQHS